MYLFDLTRGFSQLLLRFILIDLSIGSDLMIVYSEKGIPKLFFEKEVVKVRSQVLRPHVWIGTDKSQDP